MTVTGKAPTPASVAGWGDTPLPRAPLQATTIDAAQMRDAGAQRLVGPDALRPGGDDAYDTEGYIDYFTVRGFVARQPLQLPPRRPADQRRDLDPAREQGARRDAEGH